MSSIAQDTRDRIVSLESEFRATMNRVLNELSDAKQSRERLAVRLEKVEDKVDTTETVVKTVAKDLETIKPTVTDINKWRERAVGAVMIISFAAASVGSIVTAFGKKLWALLSG